MNPARSQQILQQAVAHHKAGRIEAAALLYTQLRAAEPRNFDAAHLGGLAAMQLGKPAEALTLFEKARRIDPKSAICVMRLGLAHYQLGRFDEAEKQLREACRLEPTHPEIWDNLGMSLKMQNRLPEAIEAHRRAVELKPDYLNGWYNLALAHVLAGKNVDALSFADRALALDPRNGKATYARAIALQNLHRIPEAVEAYGATIELHPENSEARSYRLMALQYIDGVTPSQLAAEHRAYGAAVGPCARKPGDFPNPRDPGKLLRVAFLSPDLRTHSISFFLLPLLAAIDRTRFEIVLYHDHFISDGMSERLRKEAIIWRNFVGQPASVVEQQILADAPDILVDLAGHTGLNRLPLFARRLAPVQATYLGYPDTTGLGTMDIRLTDGIADPEGEADANCTERLVRFSSCAWCYTGLEDAPCAASVPSSASGAVTFASFNNFAKVTDTMLRLWARLLEEVSGSRLRLKALGLENPDIVSHIRNRIAAAGLPAGRVELMGRIPVLLDHLAAYGGVDVALDAFPYNGTTTTCEALWMGVPVVTLKGDRHATRVGASLLHAVGRDDWVAENQDDYLRRAVVIAKDEAGRTAWRASARATMRASVLMDQRGQAQRLGSALREAWERHCG